MFICLAVMRMLLVLLLSLLASCATSSGPLQRELIGRWRYADAAQSCRYSFTADGKFTADVALKGKPASRFTGRWSVKGDSLFYQYLTDAQGAVPTGATDQDKLLAVRKDFFIIQAADGSQRKYERLSNPSSTEPPY